MASKGFIVKGFGRYGIENNKDFDEYRIFVTDFDLLIPLATFVAIASDGQMLIRKIIEIGEIHGISLEGDITGIIIDLTRGQKPLPERRINNKLLVAKNLYPDFVLAGKSIPKIQTTIKNGKISKPAVEKTKILDLVESVMNVVAYYAKMAKTAVHCWDYVNEPGIDAPSVKKED